MQARVLAVHFEQRVFVQPLPPIHVTSLLGSLHGASVHAVLEEVLAPLMATRGLYPPTTLPLAVGHEVVRGLSFANVLRREVATQQVERVLDEHRVFILRFCSPRRVENQVCVLLQRRVAGLPAS